MIAMHPTMLHELARIKIAEQQEYAARQRLARAAGSDRPRSIDMTKLSQRLRTRLFGGPATQGTPVGTGRPAGASA
jgi:hypothetical protein